MWRIVVLAAMLVLLVAVPAMGCTGAAAEGMGGAYLAVADGPDAVYWAPDRLYAIDPGVSLCLGTDTYAWTVEVVTPDHIGFLVENYQPLFGAPDTICAAVSVPVWHNKRYSFGVAAFIQPGGAVPLGVVPSLSYTDDGFRLTLRLDSALRLGASKRMDNCILAAEVYYQPHLRFKQGELFENTFLRMGCQFAIARNVSLRGGAIVQWGEAIEEPSAVYTCGMQIASLGPLVLDVSAMHDGRAHQDSFRLSLTILAPLFP